MRQHQKVFKLASTFLEYPDRKWFQMLPEIKKEINSLEANVRTSFNRFFQYLETTPFPDLCEKYVKTFDFHGVATLNLTYNVFKDSRKRGEALVQLRNIFFETNLVETTEELPDYAPLILEFLAEAEDDYVHRLLQLHGKSFQHLETELMENGSEYHFLLSAANEIAAKILRNAKVS